MLETDSSGAVLAVNTFCGGLVSRQVGSGSGASDTFYGFDPLGNVAQRMDATGAVVSSDVWSAYGQRLAGTGNAGSDPFGFGGQTGYYRDSETGLSLLGQRYYDPAKGRFLTRDPIGYAGGSNLYAYCGDNPANRLDPLGLDWRDWIDDNVFNGSIANLGTVTGEYDSGCASGWDVAWAGAKVTGNVVMLVAPGGAELKEAEVAARGAEDAYQGVRAASQYLKDAGVPRDIRKQILETFDKSTIRLRTARADEYGIRYYDEAKAQAEGRFLFESFPATRDSLAVLSDWNEMTSFQQWQIREGTTLIEGRAASQGYYLGGQMQKFVLDLGNLILP